MLAGVVKPPCPFLPDFSIALSSPMVKAPLELNWSRLMPDRGDAAPPEVEVVLGDGGAEGGGEVGLAMLSDHQIHEKIQRLVRMINSGFHSRLPDRGVKLQSSLKQMQAELDRRKLQKKDSIKHETLTPINTGEPASSTNVSSSSPATSMSHLKSSFASNFLKKLEDKADAVSGENLKSKKQDECKSSTENHANLYQATKPAGSSKISSEQTSANSSAGEDKMTSCSGGGTKSISNSNVSYHGGGNIISNLSKRKRALENRVSLDFKSKKAHQLVLLDDEDVQPMEPIQGEGSDERMEVKIYYPTRNDPEAVELTYSDIKCLEPESYLSSPIMNFYIQYLQRPSSPVVKSKGECHFFNTYFYSKLEEALSLKGDRSVSFLKLRRWWKGVNIFQKAYIFLPIHGDMHWSLVIICIPPKEDETGPIILHLDSLGLHSSNLIFDVVDSYLKEEWKYLNDNAIPLDLPISERMWKNLPRRIEKKKITVPQQKNEFDCGLFVLYFMERFIADAPERLRRKDHGMFGSKWFKPEDASCLRKRIQCLLAKEFENAKLDNLHS